MQQEWNLYKPTNWTFELVELAENDLIEHVQ